MSSSLSKNEINRRHLIHKELYKNKPILKKIEEYLNKGANINLKWRTDPYSSMAPLHIAVAKGQNKVVRLLINRGANVNVKDSKNKTPLDYINMLKTLQNNNILKLLNKEYTVKKTTMNIINVLTSPQIGFSPAVASLIALTGLKKNEREIAKRLLKKR